MQISHCMAIVQHQQQHHLTLIATFVAISFFVPSISSLELFPEVEITLANDGLYPIWFMCQMTDKGNSLHQLQANETYRFSFSHVAFPMRWCYLYINEKSNGFFWAYTVRSRCTKCFWSINEHPGLYRGEKGRWERQKLFMPSNFNVFEYTLESEEALEVPS